MRNGAGVVEFADADDAVKAIAELNDTEWMGNRLMVREVSGRVMRSVVVIEV